VEVKPYGSEGFQAGFAHPFNKGRQVTR